MVRMIVEKFVAWLVGPSRFERVLGLVMQQMQMQQEANQKLAETLQKVVESGGSYAKVLSDYFTAAQAATPQVRVMNDFDEATMEQFREIEKRRGQKQQIQETIKGWAREANEPPLDIPKMNDIFASMRGELS